MWLVIEMKFANSTAQKYVPNYNLMITVTTT